ncbi:hypothetical protein [Paenibacillus xylanivorans]|uniref:MarR family transcriptional regulator n=1 Tax=Paenibacillus xylanivorans TaxID=1705561 RepID=A0A0N0C2B4_9BACL|nr:hypothetical protein [Paenibacillus xylanivorans]KOY12597.1 hypothetical protein AMS66_29750 [Paenibacillus xylanivorans]
MKTFKVTVPKGYAPATYEELAKMAGLPTDEAEKAIHEMEEVGIVNIIKFGDVMFYKLNLGGQKGASQ